MKHLIDTINEKLQIGKNLKLQKKIPQSRKELKQIIEQKYNLVGKTGNLSLLDVDISYVNNFNRIFFDCDGITSIDISNWIFPKDSKIEMMFPESIEKVDISKTDFSNITTFAHMFDGCKNLKFIKGIEDIDTGKATSMEGMFNQCSSLEYLDVSNWNIGLLKNTESMFDGCENLKTVNGIEKWDFDHQIRANYNMFFGCNLKLRNILR